MGPEGGSARLVEEENTRKQIGQVNPDHKRAALVGTSVGKH